MITVQPIRPYQQEAAKRVILSVCQELWEVSEEFVLQHESLTDLDDVEGSYCNQNGVFYVLVDGERVVGTGGIRHWRDGICELKRLWFLKEYRGQGLGWLMTQKLIEFATDKGYERIRLDVYDAEKQARAIKLYRQAGFSFIERYNDGICTVFMEKVLQENTVMTPPFIKEAA
ncbi:MAG: GNAT family N-acetyltransferase [Deltaproteobacteria bacterium]|nr:GNAT family N-acetyltransferase [Deltaproteobacteria bacterium]